VEECERLSRRSTRQHPSVAARVALEVERRAAGRRFPGGEVRGGSGVRSPVAAVEVELVAPPSASKLCRRLEELPARNVLIAVQRS